MTRIGILVAAALCISCAGGPGGRVVRHERLAPYLVWHRYAAVLAEDARTRAAARGAASDDLCVTPGGAIFVLAFGNRPEDVAPALYSFRVTAGDEPLFSGLSSPVDGPASCGTECGLFSGSFLEGGRQLCFCTLFAIPLDRLASRYDLSVTDSRSGKTSTFTIRAAADGGGPARAPMCPERALPPKVLYTMAFEPR